MRGINNLLKSELYVMTRNKSFYIVLITVMLVAILTPILFNIMKIQIEAMSQPNQEMIQSITQNSREGVQGTSIGFTYSALDMTLDQTNITWFCGQVLAGGVLPIILLFFICNNLIKEFGYGTIRNKIAKGFSRAKIYFAKWLSLVIATIGLILLMVVIQSITTILIYGISPITMEMIRIILIEILLYMALVSIFFMVGMMVRKKVAMIAINILIITIGSSILSFFSFLLKDSIILTRYWIPSLITQMGNLDISQQTIQTSVVVAIVYLIITMILGVQSFKRKDIC